MAEEPKEESVKTALASIVDAQGQLEKSPGVKGLSEHIRTVLYPTMAKSLSVVDGIGESLAKALEEFDHADEDREQISRESRDFICGYVDGVFLLVQQFGASAEAWAEQGHPEMRDSFAALLEGGMRVRAYVEALYLDDDEDDEEKEKRDAG